MEHDEVKKNCISGCAAEKKTETCGGKQNSKRKKTDVIDIAQQLKNEKKITSPVRKKEDARADCTANCTEIL